MDRMVKWAKGLKVDATNGLIVSWSQTRLSFNCLRTGALVHTYKDMTPVENHVTCVLCVLQPYKYFVAGTLQGQLQVWKYSAKRRLIHTFEGHLKEVGSLEEYPGVRGVRGTLGDPNMFMSSSLDGSIKVWSLDVPPISLHYPFYSASSSSTSSPCLTP